MASTSTEQLFTSRPSGIAFQHDLLRKAARSQQKENNQLAKSPPSSARQTRQDVRHPQIPDLPPGRPPLHLLLHILPRRLPYVAGSKQVRVSRDLILLLQRFIVLLTVRIQTSGHILASGENRGKAQPIRELVLHCNGGMYRRVLPPDCLIISERFKPGELAHGAMKSSNG